MGRLSGAFGSLDEADAICQADAASASLPGTYRALLSTSSEPAFGRLGLTRAVVNTHGEVVASTAAEFWGAAHSAGVGYDVEGSPVTDRVWTGSVRDGTATHNCGDWSDGGARGMTGSPTATNASWIELSPDDCGSSLPVYCVGG